MANSKFTIEITAADRASAVVAKINAAVAKFYSPVMKADTSLTKLGKNPALEKLAKNLTATKEASVTAFEKLGLLEGGMSTLVGGAAVAGVAMLARQWGEAGQQISNAAYRIGIGTKELTGFQAAARLGGATGEAATQGSEAMGTNIGNAISGADGGQMAGLFAQLGIRAQYKNGRPDVDAAMHDVKRALDKAPTAQGKARIMQRLGIPEDLRRTIENYDSLSAEVAKMRPNAGAAADAGEKLNAQLLRVTERSGGLADNFELMLAPAMTAAMKAAGFLSAELAKWIAPGTFLGDLFKGGMGGEDGQGRIKKKVTTDIWGRPVPQDDTPSVGSAPGDTKWHNPGNLRNPGQKTFQTFETDEDGLAAAARQLIRDNTVHGLGSISQIVGDKQWGWAPASDGNNVPRYVQSTSEASNIGPNAPLDFTKQPSDAAAVLSGIVKSEQGKQPFTPEQYAEAVARALAERGQGNGQGAPVHVTVNAPPGTTVTAKSGSSVFPVRLGYGLHADPVNP